MQVVDLDKIPHPCTTTRVRLSCGNLFVTVIRYHNKIFKIFATLGKSGGCVYSQMSALTACITAGIRQGTDPRVFIDELEGIQCPEVSYEDGAKYTSCADAIAKTMLVEFGKISAGYYKEEDEEFEAQQEVNNAKSTK